MRRAVLLILIVVLLLLGAAACRGSGKASSQGVLDSTVSGISVSRNSVPESSGTGNTAEDGTHNPGTVATPAAAAGTGQAAEDSRTSAVGKNNTGVVAKSNNVVSGEDNGKVMKQLDHELDALFSGINKLDDVGDADITGERNEKR